jgi:hypothetical protein
MLATEYDFLNCPTGQHPLKNIEKSETVQNSRSFFIPHKHIIAKTSERGARRKERRVGLVFVPSWQLEEGQRMCPWSARSNVACQTLKRQAITLSNQKIGTTYTFYSILITSLLAFRHSETDTRMARASTRSRLRVFLQSVGEDAEANLVMVAVAVPVIVSDAAIIGVSVVRCTLSANATRKLGAPFASYSAPKTLS